MRMVENNAGGTDTQIVYGPTGTKVATANAGALLKAFVALPGGAKAIYNSSGLAYFRHSDWLGSSRLTSTATRPTSMYSSTAYAPFGESQAGQTSGAADASFTGQDQDTVSSLYDFTFRRYSQSQGRWISPDPAGRGAVNLTNPQSWNRYAYVGNGPTGAIDPLGLKSIPCISAPVSCILGGGGGGSDCTSDGLDEPCQMAYDSVQAGGAVQCPNNDCGIGTATPYQCLDSVCGYMSNQYAATHANEVNGQLLTDNQYNAYLVATNPNGVSGQYDRLIAGLVANFGPAVSADSSDCEVVGGHCNFMIACDSTQFICPSAGRYDDGIHIENVGGALWAHDDTVSPWTGDFSPSAFFTTNFWEHGFVDLFGGTLCGCVFSQ